MKILPTLLALLVTQTLSAQIVGKAYTVNLDKLSVFERESIKDENQEQSLSNFNKFKKVPVLVIKSDQNSSDFIIYNPKYASNDKHHIYSIDNSIFEKIVQSINETEGIESRFSGTNDDDDKEKIDLATMISAFSLGNCTLEDLGAQQPTDDGYTIVVDIRGNKIFSPKSPPKEGSRLKIFLIGPEKLLPFAAIKMTTDPYDYGSNNLNGEINELSKNLSVSDQQVIDIGECAVKGFLFNAAKAPNAGFNIEVLTESGIQKASDFSVPMRRRFKGAISLGPSLSWVNDYNYSFIKEHPDSLGVLTESRSRFSVDQTIFLTAYITPNQSKALLGVTAGFNLTNLDDNAFLGFSFAPENTLYSINAGFSFRKTKALQGSTLEIGSSYDPSLDIPTKDVWRSGFSISLSINAATALRTLGKVAFGELQ